MYQHQGVAYNTPSEAIAASIYDYMTAMGNNTTAQALASLINPYEPWGNGDGLHLKEEMELNDWTSCEGDQYDWTRALEMTIERLMDEMR